MSHRLANEFSQPDKFTEKVVDTQAPFASRNACISLGEKRALRSFSNSWKLFWKIYSVTYTSNDLFFKSASKHFNFSFIPEPVLTINCCQIVVIDLYTCFMLMCPTIYSCKIFQGFCLIVVFMLKLLRFSQINLIRQREQFFPTHLFLWPKVTLNCSYFLSITNWKCFQKPNGFLVSNLRKR